MGRQILELSEDADLVERLKKLAREESLDSAWMRVIGTVKNAVFVKADGGDTFVPGVLHLVHGDVVVTSTGGALQVQASVTVTKDGKNTICGMLKSARIVSVFVHVDSPSFADAASVSAPGGRAHADGDSSGWSGAGKEATGGRNDDEPRAESILETEDESALLERLTRRSHTPASAQEELGIDDQGASDASAASESEESAGSSWASVAAASKHASVSERSARRDAVEDADDVTDGAEDSADSSGSNPWAMVAETSAEVKKSATKKKPRSGSGRASAGSSAANKSMSRADKLKAFAESVEDFVDVDELNRGDILQHPILGECRVLRVINDDSAQVQINRGASRKLMLKIFNIIRTSDGRYRLEKKG